MLLGLDSQYEQALGKRVELRSLNWINPQVVHKEIGEQTVFTHSQTQM